MATAEKEYSVEELNYFRVCKVITSIIPGGLSTVFKQEWDNRYKSTHGEWLNTAKNGMDFYSMESPRNRKRNSESLAKIRNGNTLEWDCTCLFVGILYSDSIGASLDPAIKKSVDDLRQFRNKFAHLVVGTLNEADFQSSIEKVITAFATLKLSTDIIKEIKNEKTFPTKELRGILQQLEKEKMRNEEPQPFCVLPPKPSHEVIDRPNEITRILEEMKRLKSIKTNEITVIYLSGNPGCGKSEIARQTGERVYNDISIEENEVKFVFNLNASSIDTLTQSYIEFANRIRCDENSITDIGTSKDLSQEKKLIHLKCLIAPKLKKYSSWLLIVDNVRDIKAVSRYLPHAGVKSDGNGQLLVTTQDTRSIALDSYTYHVSLSRGMKCDDAIRALSKISNFAETDNENLLEVAEALDFQPLALACAAVYMRRAHSIGLPISWREYLQKLKEGEREATEGEFKRISLAYSQPMTAAVRMAVEKEMNRGGVMMHAFQFISVMAPEPIPLEYVVQYVINSMPEEDNLLVAAEISSSSLILLNSEDESKEISVHQVLNSCLQTNIQHNEKDEFLFLLKIIQSFSNLISFNSENVNDIVATQSLVVHLNNIAQKLYNYIENHPNTIQNRCYSTECKTTECFYSAGCISITHGKYKASNIYFKISLIIQESIYDANHPALAATLNNLGNSLHDLGQPKEAKEYYERALAIKEMAYDANHPTLASTLNNLGNSLSDLGQPKEAKEYYERALAIKEMAYDANHPTLASTLNNLGNSLRALGQPKEAKEYYERALAIQEMAYDANHPTLAATLDNLGNSLRDLGQPKEAKEYYERALAIKEMAHNESLGKRQ